MKSYRAILFLVAVGISCFLVGRLSCDRLYNDTKIPSRVISRSESKEETMEQYTPTTNQVLVIAKLLESSPDSDIVERSVRHEILVRYSLCLSAMQLGSGERESLVRALTSREIERIRLTARHGWGGGLDQAEIAALQQDFHSQLEEILPSNNVRAWLEIESSLSTWNKVQQLTGRAASIFEPLTLTQARQIYLILRSEPVGKIPEYSDITVMQEFFKAERMKRARFSNKATHILNAVQLDVLNELFEEEITSVEMAYHISKKISSASSGN